MDNVTKLFDILRDCSGLLNMKEMVQQMIVFIFVKPITESYNKGFP